MIAVTPDELHKANPQLGRMKIELGRNNDLGWVDQAAILYALAPTRDEAEVVAENVKHREELSEDEAQAMDEANRRRLILGLEPLAIDMLLVKCGRDHSSDMIKHDFFSHESPVQGKNKFWERAKNFGTTATGENIAAGYRDGMAVTVGWWRSPGHLKNMMGKNHGRIGVGQEKKHYTQLFGK